jgi:hypothetical protein
VSAHKRPPFVEGQKITVAPNYIKRAPIVAWTIVYLKKLCKKIFKPVKSISTKVYSAQREMNCEKWS